MRRPGSYSRKPPKREPYAAVVIVCEGGKTEPQYFTRLRIVHRLSSANIRIMPAGGTDPMTVVGVARSELARGGYDRAYCVFDRNGHANYSQALQTVAHSAEGRAGSLVAITSVPCFEIWVLLHFVYSTRAFTAVGTESACDRVLRQVQKHLPSYVKPGFFQFRIVRRHRKARGR
jgi:RloB-like protein